MRKRLSLSSLSTLKERRFQSCLELLLLWVTTTMLVPTQRRQDDEEEEVVEEEAFSKEDTVWSNESDDDVSKSYRAGIMT